MPWSKTIVRDPVGSFMSPNGVAEPGATPNTGTRHSVWQKKARQVQHLGEGIEANAQTFARHDQPKPSLPVFQEQVLGVRTRKGAAKDLRLLEGKNRRVGMGRPGDSKFRQFGIKSRFARVGAGRIDTKAARSLDIFHYNIRLHNGLQRRRWVRPLLKLGAGCAITPSLAWSAGVAQG